MANVKIERLNHAFVEEISYISNNYTKQDSELPMDFCRALFLE